MRPLSLQQLPLMGSYGLPENFYMDMCLYEWNMFLQMGT